MTRDWLGEGIATAMGMLHVGGLDLDDAEQVKERLQSGFPAEDFKRAGGGGDLYTDVEQERYQQLHAGAIQTTTSIELLDREAEIGIPVGWAACQPGQLRNIPDNEDGATVRAFLYRPDADRPRATRCRCWPSATTLATPNSGTANQIQSYGCSAPNTGLGSEPSNGLCVSA